MCCCCCCPPAINALFCLWVRTGFSKDSVAGALTFFPPEPALYQFQRKSADGEDLPDEEEREDEISPWFSDDDDESSSYDSYDEAAEPAAPDGRRRISHHCHADNDNAPSSPRDHEEQLMTHLRPDAAASSLSAPPPPASPRRKTLGPAVPENDNEEEEDGEEEEEDCWHADDQRHGAAAGGGVVKRRVVPMEPPVAIQSRVMEGRMAPEVTSSSSELDRRAAGMVKSVSDSDTEGVERHCRNRYEDDGDDGSEVAVGPGSSSRARLYSSSRGSYGEDEEEDEEDAYNSDKRSAATEPLVHHSDTAATDRHRTNSSEISLSHSQQQQQKQQQQQQQPQTSQPQVPQPNSSRMAPQQQAAQHIQEPTRRGSTATTGDHSNKNKNNNRPPRGRRRKRSAAAALTDRQKALRRRAKRRNERDERDAQNAVRYDFRPDSRLPPTPPFGGSMEAVKIGPHRKTGSYIAAVIYRVGTTNAPQTMASENDEAHQMPNGSGTAAPSSSMTPSAPSSSGSGKKKIWTLLYSHGNATDIGAMNFMQSILATSLEINVVMYDYSGYGRSGGIPLESNTYRDIAMVYDYVVQNVAQHQDESSVILYGQSVGSGPSCYLAAQKPKLGGLVLHSPFMSGMRVLTPSRALACLDIFPNVDRMKKVSCPVMIIHGRMDEEVSVEHGVGLYNAVPSHLKRDPWWVPNRGHNDITDGSRNLTEYIRRLRVFLDGLEAAPEKNAASSNTTTTATIRRFRR